MDGQEAIDERLLEAASRVVERHGISGATLERVAEEAGRSRATLHRRGVFRRALIEALAARAADQYRQALWPALVAPGTGRERLEHALTAMCEVADDHLALLAGLFAGSESPFHETGDDAVATGEAATTRLQFTQPLERLVLDGARDGSLRAVDAGETATVLFNMVGWTYVHLRFAHGWSAARTRERLLDLTLRGLLPETAASDRKPRASK